MNIVILVVSEEGIINQYLKPLNLTKTYYSFDRNNVHFVFIDPYIDYKPGSVSVSIH